MSACKNNEPIPVHRAMARRGRSFATFSSQFSVLSFRRFLRDERGQGIIFAAASLIVLVGFVALVYNLGRIIEGRTRVQVAADSAAYSGAMVEANSLSAIGWINSAMAQTYYNSLKYAVDVNVTGVAARMELIRTGGVASGPAVMAHRQAWDLANTALPQAKSLMVQLSQTENAVAILTPRLLAEEMFAIGTRAGGERLSVFPSQRLFPYPESLISFSIEQLGNGWRVTNLTGGSKEMIQVTLVDGQWHILYSLEGVTETEVIISQESPNRWKISFYTNGALTEEIYLVKTDDLGWVVWGQAANGGPSLPTISFEKVDMDGDGTKEGTKVTCGNLSQTFKNAGNGHLYLWDNAAHSYTDMTSNTTTIAGVEVRMNVTNVIHFPGDASATIGDPTQVTIGHAHLTLSDPPTISTTLGPVTIGVHGFDPNSFSVTAGGFSLTAGDADGRWRKWFDPTEQVWSRQQLTEVVPEHGGLKQWQYDHETSGAMLSRERNMNRYVYTHAFGDRGISGNQLPAWTAWFNPIPDNTGTAGPREPFWRHTYPLRPPGSLAILQPNEDPPEDAYYQTEPCPEPPLGCGGSGVVDVPNDPNDPNQGTHKEVCKVCGGYDNNRDGATDIRVFIADIPSGRINPPDPRSYDLSITDGQRGWTDTDFLDSRVHRYDSYILRNAPAAPAGYPLVLTDEFFKYGVNVGVYKQPDLPMLFPQALQPPWGYVAISCSRVGVPDDGGGTRYQFGGKADRANWVEQDPNNLYMAGATAKLYPSRDQMQDYDLDDEIIQGQAITLETENALSYLWDTVLSAQFASGYDSSGWATQFNGQGDPSIALKMRQMSQRRDEYGKPITPVLDYGNRQMSDVVEH